MKRIIEVEHEYKRSPKKAIAMFFARHPELAYWQLVDNETGKIICKAY